MSASFLHVPRTPVCLCGAGARTPLGLCPESAAAAVRAGLSAIEEHPFLVDQEGEPMRLARDAFLPPDLPIGDRLRELLASTLPELPLDRPAPRLLVLLCLPEPRPGLPSALGELLGRGLAGHWGAAERRIGLLPFGHAGGLIGFAMAAEAVEDGTADLAVVVGVDSYHDPDTLEGMDAAGDLKSEANRDGFFPGEAGGACLLARADRVRDLGLEPLARLAAVSAAVEPVPLGADGVCVGEGLSAAFLGLAPAIEADGRRITDTWCDLNGQRYRSEELLYTVLRAQHLSVDAHAYQHPADCWGDVGAASGPLLATLAVAAARKGYANGARAALWASSEGGRRAVALLDLPERDRA